MTDENVLRTLMQHRRLTRAELAAATGISKPTVGESVRRLGEAGLVVDTGERTQGGRGRGRVGTYYALAEEVGTALAISVAPEGVVAERIDAYGEVVARSEEAVARPAHPTDVAAALHKAAAAASGPPAASGTASAAGAAAGGRIRVAVVSAADPVDRASGRMIHLPDSPFLLGELDPHDVLAPLVAGPIVVDNDVNWAARAERDDARDFAYLYLGEGLGGAIVSDGEVRQGAGGLAGEIAHLITVGPSGRATRLIDVFDELGLRQPDSTAIDVTRLLATIAATGEDVRRALGEAVAGVIAAIVALTDPSYVVIGGPWGTHPAILAAITTAAADQPRQVPIRAARRTGEPSLTGARLDALDRLRDAIVRA
ncbi:ROK family transcriptional regulator [Cryptosporangium phraense]|uniref:ROK family transcriptional regulator n=2 Tax=Cryptosporangium phraense TaxID=2593070 RepID=A0A545AJH0_9ACTN|nr:ROK family transcriptional regulator [Cryptosporangium phraense]